MLWELNVFHLLKLQDAQVLPWVGHPGVKFLSPFSLVFWDLNVLPATSNAGPEHHCEVNFNVSI